MNRNNELVLFSGGKDSFLTALRVIEYGNRAILMTFNNGCIQGIKNTIETANLILHKYGPEYVTVLEPKSCIREFQMLRFLYLYKPIQNIAVKHPALLLNQLNCIACKSAMYINAIKYCKKHDIPTISEGARESQPYLVQKERMIRQFKEICEKNGITLRTPIANIEYDYDVKLKIAQFGFICAKTYECQCWMGVPEMNPPTEEQISCIINFFENEIKPLVENYIHLR